MAALPVMYASKNLSHDRRYASLCQYYCCAAVDQRGYLRVDLTKN